MDSVHVGVVGSFAVGKTSMLMRAAQINNLEHCTTEFPSVRSTVCVDFLMLDYGEENLTLQVWDTAGQERFSMLSAMCFRRSHILLVVFDVASRESLVYADKLVVRAKIEHPQPQLLKVFIVANKADLTDDQRHVSMLEASEYAKSIGASYFETSTRRDMRWTVGALFKSVAQTGAALLCQERPRQLKLMDPLHPGSKRERLKRRVCLYSDCRQGVPASRCARRFSNWTAVKIV